MKKKTLKKKREIPFSFVLEELEALSPWTRPMFGCTSVYVEDRIVLILRQSESGDPDNGVWLATTPEHHASLAKEFPSMRSIEIFGPKATGWQILPEDSADFEDSVLRACELVRQGDERIGKIPVRKKPKTRSKKSC